MISFVNREVGIVLFKILFLEQEFVLRVWGISYFRDGILRFGGGVDYWKDINMLFEVKFKVFRRR